ncbi:acetyl-CoA carboxylase [Bradyrhizobium prioriisuperbiae]|uniref:acetyl-CoA carboxylase n=1 Tax=Bradyrhizobium prioriisuperbiae TaxID=2854389 RepID=UPI0028EDB432|nr:acetyl-CoA carboxylase [Bradyrhizobium prioritasuperba]
MTKADIRSPLPGVFYRRPSPDSAPFKSDGDPVVTDDVIGIIEVMKSFHEVRAEVAGTAIRFVIDDADAVMAGQTIAEVQQ